MNYRRAFVSGGAGVIGTALVNRLLENGVEVFVGDLKPCPLEWRGRLRYRRGDLNTISKRDLNAFAPEVFFHLAAAFERSEESPAFFKENFHHNIALSHHLIDCLQESSSLQRVIFASSYLVYDPSQYLFDDPQDDAVSLKETASIQPRNLCGAAKFFHESELHFMAGIGVPAAMARIFRGYGRDSRDVISRWVRQALSGESIQVYCPENRFDYIFADDTAEGLLQLADSDYCGIVNLGTGYARTIGDVLKILKTHFPKLEYHVAEPSIPVYESSQADMSHFVEITGWCPEHTLEMGLPKIIDYERNKRDSEPEIPEYQGILITSVSKKVPLVEAVRSAAQKLGSFEAIHGADSDPLCIGRSAVDYFWEMPLLDQITRENIRDYCHHHGIGGIIPTRDGELEFFSEQREWFAENDIRVMVSDLKSVQICLDKLRFAQWLAEHGYPAVPTRDSLDEIESSTYVVKERYGAGSLEIGLNMSKSVAEAHGKKLTHPIFQPYVKGIEYSVDVYRDETGNVKGCIARRRDRVVQGESQVTTTERKIALENMCKRLAAELNLYGHAVFQVIETSDRALHVIECNPRFGGASTASIAAGLDTFYWFLLECSGESIEKYPFERCKGEVRQIRYAVDKVTVC